MLKRRGTNRPYDSEIQYQKKGTDYYLFIEEQVIKVLHHIGGYRKRKINFGKYTHTVCNINAKSTQGKQTQPR